MFYILVIKVFEFMKKEVVSKFFVFKFFVFGINEEEFDFKKFEEGKDKVEDKKEE